jgi:DedD protein
MGLFSFLQRGNRSSGGASREQASRSAVEEQRTRARRRLIGAAILVVVAVASFPLLLETEPRPVRSDLRIEIPQHPARPGATPPGRLAEPASAVAPAAGSRSEAPRTDAAPAAASEPEVAARPAETKPAEGRTADAKPPQPPVPDSTASPRAATPAGGAGTAAVQPAPAASQPAADAARAQALLEGRAPENRAAERAQPAAAGARFVVQVGAFAEADAARNVRVRVEKLGLRTYTQEVDTAAGKRTRVRVGPFAERDQADRTAAKIKAAGIAAAVLTL